MAAVPTLPEEDARRPNRERDCLVRERTRIAGQSGEEMRDKPVKR
jgi:transposase